MSEIVDEPKGWKPIPLSLKILSVVMVLWSVGSVMNMPNLMHNGLPLFGMFVYGLAALLVVLILDIVGPLAFLFGLWNKKPWAAKWAFAYIGIFVLNGLVALVTVREHLGLPQILVPTIAGMAFLAVIFWNREYFARTK